jgi:hypothetical protein
VIIQVRTDSMDGEAPWALQPGQECFYCMQEINLVGVFWLAQFDLWLHKQCCQRLMLRLSRDCWEIECKHGDIEELPLR